MIDAFGCGTCHVIPGASARRGKIGPPLTAFAQRHYIAGEVVNTLENLTTRIVNPAIEPGTAMPLLDVTAAQALKIAAYLYTLE